MSRNSGIGASEKFADRRHGVARHLVEADRAAEEQEGADDVDPEKGEGDRQADRHQGDQDAQHEDQRGGPVHGSDPVRQVAGIRHRRARHDRAPRPDAPNELDRQQGGRGRDHREQRPFRNHQLLVEHVAPGEGVDGDP